MTEDEILGLVFKAWDEKYKERVKNGEYVTPYDTMYLVILVLKKAGLLLVKENNP